MKLNNARVLVIDDDPEIQSAYAMVLSPGDGIAGISDVKLEQLLHDGRIPDAPAPPCFELSFAEQGPKGVAMAAAALETNLPYAVAFIDIRMPPGFDGMETAARIRRIDPDIEIVMVTAYSDRSREEIVRAVGRPERLLFLRKPFDPDELTQMALSLTAKWNLARQAEAQRNELEAVLTTSPAAIFAVNKDQCITSWNPAAEQITGYAAAQVLGQPCIIKRISDQQTCKRCPLVTADAASQQQEIQIMDSKGVTRTLLKNNNCIKNRKGRIVCIVESFWDITERKATEAQLRHSQKLEALGTLAGGIAHDLNNVLTPIMGGAQLSLMKLDPDHPIYANLRTIEQGVQRAAELLHQILAFSRKQVMTTKPLSLTVLIKNLAAMLRRLIREDIRLTFVLDEALWTIEADQNQMEQILINLVVNARDALAEGGEVIIRTANRLGLKHDRLEAEGQPIMPGAYVVMSVSDNGTGMQPVILSRIFDPFFTTKEPGKGTGLGLSTVYGIVKQHGGEIRVNSAPGRGSCFNIYFPKTEGSTTANQQSESLEVSGGKETILLVEDNPDVRDMTCISLKHYGYRVIEASNGLEASQLFAELQGRVDLLLTDVVMPGMGGKFLAETLRARKHGLPVLFMSGHPFDVNTKGLAEMPGNDFIEKPFKPLDLAQKIRNMLDRARKSA